MHPALQCEPHMPISRSFVKVSDRTRTGDHLDHNQELYQLSYAHHELGQCSGWSGKRGPPCGAEAPPAGFEPAARCLEGSRSVH